MNTRAVEILVEIMTEPGYRTRRRIEAAEALLGFKACEVVSWRCPHELEYPPQMQKRIIKVPYDPHWACDGRHRLRRREAEGREFILE